MYELRFEDEVGTHYRLHGEKHLSLLQPVSGMTTLYTEIWDTDEAAVVARGVLRFDLGDLRPWLASWRAPATPLPALEADAVASA